MTSSIRQPDDGATSSASKRIAQSAFGPGIRLGKLFDVQITLDMSLLLVFGLVLLNLGGGFRKTPSRIWCSKRCYTVISVFFRSFKISSCSAP
jgi:hypothetical protein